jgi:hypothetical protein
MGGKEETENTSNGLSFDVLHIIFNYCSSVSKFRLAVACKSIFEFFKNDIEKVKDARSLLILEMQTRARIMAADYGCYNNYGGQSSKQVWKAVMRKMGINPKFCVTENECSLRMINMLKKRSTDELERMLHAFRTFNVVFHDILVETERITQNTTFGKSFYALLASNVPTGPQRIDRVMMFVDMCINSSPDVLQQILDNSMIINLLKESMDVTNNPTLLLQYMRFPNDDLRYWCDVALKNVANA